MERHEEMLSPEEQYAQLAPTLDADGFSLYAAAEEVTGLKVYEEFPYEDNRGMFELADGHTLLRYLEAAYFGTVMKAVKLLEDSGVPQEVLKEEKAEVYEQLSEVNRKIRAEREKRKLCREICQQTPVMEQDIQKTEEHQKEVREHEHRRR